MLTVLGILTILKSIYMRLSTQLDSVLLLRITFQSLFHFGLFMNRNSIWCAVQNDSTVAKFIKENPKCGFEIGPNKPPYMGIRGQGTAKLVPKLGGKKLKKLINRYLGDTNQSLTNWLLSRSENEVAICIEPICFYSWDYSARMN